MEIKTHRNGKMHKDREMHRDRRKETLMETWMFICRTERISRNRQTKTQTDRHTGRYKNRQKKTNTDRQPDTKTHTNRVRHRLDPAT